MAEATVHRLVVTYDHDRVAMRAVCGAPPGADCHLVSDCECESYPIQRDSRGPFHTVVEFDDQDEEVEVRHDMEPGEECNTCLWLNESDCLEELAEGRPVFEIGTIPVETVWTGSEVAWKPVVREVPPGSVPE